MKLDEIIVEKVEICHGFGIYYFESIDFGYVFSIISVSSSKATSSPPLPFPPAVRICPRTVLTQGAESDSYAGMVRTSNYFLSSYTAMRSLCCSLRVLS